MKLNCAHRSFNRRLWFRTWSHHLLGERLFSRLVNQLKLVQSIQFGVLRKLID